MQARRSYHRSQPNLRKIDHPLVQAEQDEIALYSIRERRAWEREKGIINMKFLFFNAVLGVAGLSLFYGEKTPVKCKDKEIQSDNPAHGKSI